MSLPLPNLDVGRDAMFVWPAYALSALALLTTLADSLLRTRKWRREAERLRDPADAKPPP